MNWSWVLFNSVVTLAGTAYTGYILLPQYSLAAEMGSHYRQDILRQLLVEDRIRESEEEVQNHIDEVQVRQSNLVSDECLLAGRRRSHSLRESDYRLPGRQPQPGGPERTPSFASHRPRRPRAPMWQRHAAAAEIQRSWRRHRDASRRRAAAAPKKPR